MIDVTPPPPYPFLFVAYKFKEGIAYFGCVILLSELKKYVIQHNVYFIFYEITQQIQLYAVNFITLLGSLCMFRVFYTPIIRSTIFNCIYSHCYKP